MAANRPGSARGAVLSALDRTRRLFAELAEISADAPGVTRASFGPTESAAHDMIRREADTLGLEQRTDAVGNLYVTLPGRNREAPVLMTGSHLDSVPHGGNFDGAAGVLAGLVMLERLAAASQPECDVTLMVIRAEEMIWFPEHYLGSRAAFGLLPPDTPDRVCRSDNGRTLADHMVAAGFDPQAIRNCERQLDPAKIKAFVEVHIEQGPVLEAQDTALGIVTGICGIERNTVTFTGDTGHAGTVPMDSRRDALVAASDFISAIHDAAKKVTDLRATIGALSLHPNVVNAIPRAVELTLEIRALNDAVRDDFARLARYLGDNISGERRVGFSMERTYEQPAVPCNGDLIDALSTATGAICPTAPRLPSGATHDASAMADLCPISMLFVRCEDGVSHKPEEFAASDDMDAAIQSIAAFLVALEV